MTQALRCTLPVLFVVIACGCQSSSSPQVRTAELRIGETVESFRHGPFVLREVKPGSGIATFDGGDGGLGLVPRSKAFLGENESAMLMSSDPAAGRATIRFEYPVDQPVPFDF